ncbi:divalent metal cation transporter [Dyella sp. 20L07]|uniref:divalent metal cation transporter n=1 Tax=Dyella sp. 20L07 TaxID=3384240 RepID=UPI003D26CDCF
MIGRVTGCGLMSGIRTYYPSALVYGLVVPIVAINVTHLATDIGAMGAALKLLIGCPALVYAALFALASLLLRIFIPFLRYSPTLKFLTLSLFAYVATVLVIHVPWGCSQEPRRSTDREECRICRWRRGLDRHHVQPLSILLAGRAGGRGDGATQ